MRIEHVAMYVKDLEKTRDFFDWSCLEEVLKEVRILKY